jgi:hypothetical protein
LDEDLRIRRIRKPLVAAAAVLTLLPASWLIKRVHDAAPQSIIASTIIVSDLRNDTGDSSFEGAFRQTVGFELRSSSLNVLRARVTEILSEMRKAPGTRLTPEIAREVCERTASAASSKVPFL